VPISRIAPAPRGEPADEEPRASAFLERAEVRDVLAWMRLLVDPQDAAAVVRALTRPPIDLRQVDLARVIQVARRRKLDLVSGLTAATESPQVPPEARERIQRFAELHRSSLSELDGLPGDIFVARLIERLGVRGRPLLAPEQAAEQQASLDQLRELAAEFVRRKPGSTPREMARHLAALVGGGHPENLAGGWSGTPAQTVDPGGSQPGQPRDTVATTASELEATLHLMREEVLASVARIGGRLGELRLDTDLDISHGVVRYLELLKLSALLQRPAGEGVAEALSDINARLLAAATPLQRDILQTSTLDDALLGEESGQPGPRSGSEAGARIGPLGEPSLGPFLPRKGIGLALSASDIETYRSCPLRYKFARVLRIPTGQTLHQRFGIAVHQVLERYHSEGGETLTQMLDLLDAGWRRGGFGEREREIELREKARAALTRYHERLGDQDSHPVSPARARGSRRSPRRRRG
jgi:hypothetical protein